MDSLPVAVLCSGSIEGCFVAVEKRIAKESPRGLSILRGPCGTGFFRQALDVVEKLGLFVADSANEVQIFEFAFLLLVLPGQRALGKKLME